MTELAREYAGGLYELCAEEAISEAMLSELEALLALTREQPDFLRLLSNLSLPKGERVGILDAALRGQVHPYLLSFLKLLCERGAILEFADCVKAYRERYNAANGIAKAVVTTSAPLSKQQRDSLMKRLAAMTGRRVELEEKLDPSIIDGVLLEMDGRRYDNTLRQRLRAIREAMVSEA